MSGSFSMCCLLSSSVASSSSGSSSCVAEMVEGGEEREEESRRVGDILLEGEGEEHSPFVRKMRSLLERAAAEEREEEEREERMRKKRRLERMISHVKMRMGEDEEGGEEGQAEPQVIRTAEGAARHDRSKHKKLVKNEPKEPIVCDKCGKQFSSPFQLKEHISILHLKERNFECDICGQKFGRRGGVRRHVLMVHLNQLHMCPYDGCDHPGYKCSKALAAHIRSVHTNIRPYECGICEKRFVRRNDLKMHEQTHQEEASFHCDCGASFRRALYLKKHQKNCPSSRFSQSSSNDDDY